MRLTTLFIILILTVSLAFSVQAASTASISYGPDAGEGAKFVKDVPFWVDVKMSVPTDVSNNNVYALLVHTKADGFTDTDSVFVESSRGSWLPNAGNPDQNRALAKNSWQYMFTSGHGTVDMTKDTAKTLHKLKVKTTSSGTITLDNSKNNKIEGPEGVFEITSITPLTVNTFNSECGDGVVGYIDGNTLGIKDGNDVNEACDQGNKVGSTASDNYATQKDGCSADCKVVDIGWDCTNKGFGQRNSVCTAMPKGKFFAEKMTALFDTKTCYPNNIHPGRLYQEYCDNDNSNDEKTTRRSWIIGKINAALVEYFIS